MKFTIWFLALLIFIPLGCGKSDLTGGIAVDDAENIPDLVSTLPGQLPVIDAPNIQGPYYYDRDSKDCLNADGVPGHNPNIVHCGKAETQQVVNVRFDNKDLKGVNLSYTNLTSVMFRQADLEGGDFRSSRLKDVDLTGAELTDADFSGAIISMSDLSDEYLHESLIDRGIQIGLDNTLPQIIIDIEEVLDAEFDITSNNQMEIDDLNKDTGNLNIPNDRVPASDNSTPTDQLAIEDLKSEGEVVRSQVGALQDKINHSKELIRNERQVLRRMKNLRISKRLELRDVKNNIVNHNRKINAAKERQKNINQKLRQLRREIKSASDDIEKNKLRINFAALKKEKKELSLIVRVVRKEKREIIAKVNTLRNSVKKIINDSKKQREYVQSIQNKNKAFKIEIKNAMKDIKRVRKEIRALAKVNN